MPLKADLNINSTADLPGDAETTNEIYQNIRTKGGINGTQDCDLGINGGKEKNNELVKPGSRRSSHAGSLVVAKTYALTLSEDGEVLTSVKTGNKDTVCFDYVDTDHGVTQKDRLENEDTNSPVQTFSATKNSDSSSHGHLLNDSPRKNCENHRSGGEENDISNSNSDEDFGSREPKTKQTPTPEQVGETDYHDVSDLNGFNNDSKNSKTFQTNLVSGDDKVSLRSSFDSGYTVRNSPESPDNNESNLVKEDSAASVYSVPTRDKRKGRTIRFQEPGESSESLSNTSSDYAQEYDKGHSGAKALVDSEGKSASQEFVEQDFDLHQVKQYVTQVTNKAVAQYKEEVQRAQTPVENETDTTSEQRPQEASADNDECEKNNVVSDTEEINSEQEFITARTADDSDSNSQGSAKDQAKLVFKEPEEESPDNIHSESVSNTNAVRTSHSDTVKVSPSHSNTVKVSPSHSDTVKVSPSHSDTVKVSPSHSDTVKVSPSHSDTVKVSPSHSDAVKVSPSHSDTVKVNPSHSDTVKVSPSHSDTVKVNPSHSATVKVSPSRSDTVKVSSSHSDTVKVSPSHSHIVKVSPTHSDTETTSEVFKEPESCEGLHSIQSISGPEQVSIENVPNSAVIDAGHEATDEIAHELQSSEKCTNLNTDSPSVDHQSVSVEEECTGEDTGSIKSINSEENSESNQSNDSVKTGQQQETLTPEDPEENVKSNKSTISDGDPQSSIASEVGSSEDLNRQARSAEKSADKEKYIQDKESPTKSQTSHDLDNCLTDSSQSHRSSRSKSHNSDKRSPSVKSLSGTSSKSETGSEGKAQGKSHPIENTSTDHSKNLSSEKQTKKLRKPNSAPVATNLSHTHTTMEKDDRQTHVRPKSSNPRRRGQQQMVAPSNTDGRISPNAYAPRGDASGRASPNRQAAMRGRTSPSKPPVKKSRTNERTESPKPSQDPQRLKSEGQSKENQINGDSSVNGLPVDQDANRPASAMSETSERDTPNIFITDDNNVIAQTSDGGHDISGQDDSLTESSSLQNNNKSDRDPGSSSAAADIKGIPFNSLALSRTSDTSSPASNDRLSRIAEAAENVSHMQDNLQDMFREARLILSDYESHLKSRPLTEFVEEIPDFTRTFSSLSDAYRSCESVTGGINTQLKDIRKLTNEICGMITHNFQREGLEAWTEGTENSAHGMEVLKEKRIARQKHQEARMKEVKAMSARAAAEAQSAHELAAQAEVEATEAETEAASARLEAEVAVKKAEEARVAAIERQKAEDEARKKAEEKARQKAEEERRKQREEERRLAEEARKKGMTLDDEKRRLQEAKARLEAERKNPNNWPRYIYSVDHSDFDPGVGIVLRSLEGSLGRDDMLVNLVDQLTGCLPIVESEELVSNIVHVVPADPEKVFKFEEPPAIAIPTCGPRIHPGREPIVKMLTSEGRVVILPAHEVVFEDIKDLRFAEVRTRRFGTMAVFLRVKKETLTFNRSGGKVMSSVDSRVTLSCQPRAFKNSINFIFEVQHIDPHLISDLKEKKPLECGKLLSSSPVISMHLPGHFSSPLTVTLPCPLNPALRPKRPKTAGNRLAPQTREDDRPLSARSLFGSSDENTLADEIHLLRKEGDNAWIKLDDVRLIQTKSKDLVTFDIAQNFIKLAVIRTKPDVSNVQAEKMIGHIMVSLTFKPVSVIMRQKSAEPSEVMITCTHPANTERAIQTLADDGYDHGPRPSSEIMMTEGQRLELRLRGNLMFDNDARTCFAYNTHIPFKVNFTVEEQDKYAQKGFDSYRGFSQVYTTGKVKKNLDIGDERDRATSQRMRDEYVDGDVLLCEQLIIIPKPDVETPRPLTVANVSLTAEGIVNHDLLRFLSVHLQYSDWKKLAQILNVKRSRIQAILRQNMNNDVTHTIYDMLVTWSKRLPRAMDRVEILSQALVSIGRLDLADELQTREDEYKTAKASNFRETHLRKAFITIVKNPKAVLQWKQLARFLEVSDSELERIESMKENVQERCLTSLHRWKEMKGEEAAVSLLANKLRSCRYRKLAREIENNS